MRKLLIPIVATVFVVLSMAYQARTVEPVLCEVPEARLGELAGYVSEKIEASEAERHVLPDDTIIDKRLYRSSDGEWFQVSLIIGGKSKSSIHRPEMCLPAQGFLMQTPRELDAGGTVWHVITLARRDVSMGFAYTFFNQEGYKTSSHVRRIFRDVWDRSVRGQIDRWAMVTVNASTCEDRRLVKFLDLLKGVVR